MHASLVEGGREGGKEEEREKEKNRREGGRQLSVLYTHEACSCSSIHDNVQLEVSFVREARSLGNIRSAKGHG